MSGKSASAQSQVTERRLRPIYDALDNGNNKKALQEAEKVLKRQPNLQCAKVLMSLALLRLGRDADAKKMYEEVLAESPTEDSVLQAMTIVLKESFQHERVADMYENATKKEPNNEELLSHLFMSYVRLGNYKKQQQAALQLYKAKPMNPYYYWAVMSIVLQAKCCKVEDKRTAGVMLPLAERMMDKMHRDGKMDQEQEIHLYLLILELQGKFKEGLDLLSNDLGLKLEERTAFIELVNKKKLHFNVELKQWGQVRALSKDLLEKCPDQWEFYISFINSTFNSCHDELTLQEALSFIKSKQEQNPNCRGPYLAEMDFLIRRLIGAQGSNDDALQDNLLKACQNYFKRFGAKPTCATDLKYFICELDRKRQRQLVDETFKVIKFVDGDKPEKISDIHLHVNWYQLSLFLGFLQHLPREKAHELIQALESHFQKSQELVKNYPGTDQRPSDAYIIIAAYILWYLWIDSANDEYFWKAVVLLEFALNLSPSNYHIRFLLLKFYNQIGAVGKAETIHTGLEVKQIQLDSLSYLLLPHLMACGFFQLARVVQNNTLKFFNNNSKEILDHAMAAYRYGTFSQVLEFTELQNRLNNSQTFKSLATERLLTSILSESALHSQVVQMIAVEDIDFDKIKIMEPSDVIDNRDFQQALAVDPIQRETLSELQRQNSFHEFRFAKARQIIATLLSAIIHLSEEDLVSKYHKSRSEPSHGSTVENGEGKPASEDLKDKIRIWMSALQSTQVESQKCFADFQPREYLKASPILGPDCPRLHQLLQDQTVDIFLVAVKLVLDVHGASNQEPGEFSQCHGILGELNNMFNDVTEALQKRFHKEGSQSMLFRHRLLESLVNVIEAGSFICIALGACRGLLKPLSKGAAGKKSKKKKELSAEATSFIQSFNAALSKLELTFQTLCDIVESVSKVIEVDKLSSCVQHKFSQIQLSETKSLSATDPAHSLAMDSLQESIAQGLDSSYQFTHWELNGVLKKKSEYLNALKL